MDRNYYPCAAVAAGAGAADVDVDEAAPDIDALAAAMARIVVARLASFIW